jgi:hypothetical protein
MFMTDTGLVVTQPMLVPPRGRATLFANVVVPNTNFGIRVESDQPVVAERAVYFQNGSAGFQTVAVAAPAVDWYLPEGSTTDSFVEQLAILNPNPQPAVVQFDFRRQGGGDVQPLRLTVGPNLRATVDVNALVSDGQSAVHVVANRPVVVERTEYFSRPEGVGATNAVGLTR